MLLHDLKRRAVLHPEDAEARCALGEALLAERQLEAATQQLEKALQLDPDHARARRLLARAYAEDGRPTRAERVLADQVAREPDNADTREALAELLADMGRVDEAILHLEEAIRVTPEHLERRLQAAELSSWKGFVERARGHLGHARRLAAGDPAAGARIQEIALAIGDAAALYEAAPRGREILLGRAKAALEAPPLREAVRAGALREAAARLRQEDLGGAKRALVAAPAEEQRGEAFEVLRAEIALLEGDRDKAVRAFRRCVERAPGVALAWGRLGELLAAAGEHAESARCYEAALRLAPDDPETLEGLGDALARQGLREAALARYEQALARRPVAVLAGKVAGLTGDLRDVERGPAVGRIGTLWWSSLGGDVYVLEAAAVPGKGELVFTGNFHKEVQEAGQVAFSCLKARAESLGITRAVTTHDLHLHIVETEIRKHGRSLGLALALAGASAYLGRPLRPRLAATGEITLQGAVKPIAGLREKLVAAYLAGVEVVILPRRNLFTLEEVPAEVTRKVALVHVDSLPEALGRALSPAEAPR